MPRQFLSRTVVTAGLSLLAVAARAGTLTVNGNLHFAESVFTNGATNTFAWSSEGTVTTTNLGAVTDVWSNQYNGAIGEEPVIAWGWPPP